MSAPEHKSKCLHQNTKVNVCIHNEQQVRLLFSTSI